MSEVKRYKMDSSHIPSAVALSFLPSVLVSAEDYDRLAAENERLQAELEALKQKTDHIEDVLAFVPDGWALVPVEPTEEMLDAKEEDGDYAVRADEYYFRNRDAARSFSSFVWGRMLDATPIPIVNQKLTNGGQQADREPVGYFVQPYTDRHEVIERVDDSCAGDDDVFPLYRHPPSVSGLVEALDNLVEVAADAMREANRDGAGYDIDEELAEARVALAAYSAKGGQ